MNTKVKVTSECYKLLIIDPDLIFDHIHRNELDELLDLLFSQVTGDRFAFIDVEPFKQVVVKRKK